MLKLIIALIVPPILGFILYVVMSFLIYVWEEIRSECKKFKRICRQGKWDLEWQWKLFREGVKQWNTES